jgi:ubiquinone/menaquinone biosynthesis C-methylase UbiE
VFFSFEFFRAPRAHRAALGGDAALITEIGLFLEPGAGPLTRLQRPLPWQYRAITEWWPELVSSEAETRRLQRFVAHSGSPALEVGFGSGERVLACRRAGIDIDGVEPSQELFAACRERFERLGESTHRLYWQPLHEIELPRRYASVYVGRGLGASANAAFDALALRRLHRALETGGMLLLEQPSPEPWLSRWASWMTRAEQAPALDPHVVQDARGRERIELSVQAVRYSAERGTVSFTACARHYDGAALRVAHREACRQRLYSPREIRGLLRRAGFDARRIHGRYSPDAGRWLWWAEKTASRGTDLPLVPPRAPDALEIAAVAGLRYGGVGW